MARSIFDDSIACKSNSSLKSRGVPSIFAEGLEAESMYANASPVYWPGNDAWRKAEDLRKYISGDGKTFDFEK